MSFKKGAATTKLKKTGTVGKRNTGTYLRFWPEKKYFDSANFSISRLRHVLRAKAVLCPGLSVEFLDEKSGDKESWLYEGGLQDYLGESLYDRELLPQEPFTASLQGSSEQVDWALTWQIDAGELVTESYVNLIPTAQGGTHVNGLRTGLTEALREFCEFRSLLPRGVKLSPEDVWDRVCYVLSVKLVEPQFSGQTKERLSSRECATFVSGVVKDAFSLWLIITLKPVKALPCWRWRTRRKDCVQVKKSFVKKSPQDQLCRASWRIVLRRILRALNCFWWKATPPVVQQNRRVIESFRPSCHCAAKF